MIINELIEKFINLVLISADNHTRLNGQILSNISNILMFDPSFLYYYEKNE